MFMVQCNHPGCNEHARFSSPNVDWNCGRHVPPALAQKPPRYLPSRHPHRKQFSQATKQERNEQ